MQGLNPVPFAAMVAVTAGWVAYASVKQNYFVLLANGPGLIIGVFLVMSLQGFASRPVCSGILQLTLTHAMSFFVCISMTMNELHAGTRYNGVYDVCWSAVLCHCCSPDGVPAIA